MSAFLLVRILNFWRFIYSKYKKGRGRGWRPRRSVGQLLGGRKSYVVGWRRGERRGWGTNGNREGVVIYSSRLIKLKSFNTTHTLVLIIFISHCHCCHCHCHCHCPSSSLSSLVKLHGGCPLIVVNVIPLSLSTHVVVVLVTSLSISCHYHCRLVILKTMSTLFLLCRPPPPDCTSINFPTHTATPKLLCFR